VSESLCLIFLHCDGQQFHQYQHNDQLPQIIEHKKENVDNVSGLNQFMRSKPSLSW